jgi:hypothetical protein
MRAVALFALLVLATAFPPEGHVITPYGVRPKACVIELESGEMYSEVPEGVKISSKIDGVVHERIVVPAPECHQDNIVERVKTRHEQKQSGAFPINGWLDNAGWYPPTSEANIYKFTSTYTIPGNPAQNSGQVLFFFIGTQDNDAAAVNILQPVLTWGNGLPGWNAASWACCPKNITVQSKSIPNLSAGQHLAGTILRQNADTWMIDTRIVETGQNTTLYAQVGDYNYNWVDVTQEVYSVTSCQQFAQGPTTFASLTITDAAMNVITPSWSITGATDCQGVESQVSATTITIQHN